MPIIPQTQYHVMVKDQVAKPLFPALSLRASFAATLLETLEMGKGLPDGWYRYTIEWKLIKGVKWNLTKIL